MPSDWLKEVTWLGSSNQSDFNFKENYFKVVLRPFFLLLKLTNPGIFFIYFLSFQKTKSNFSKKLTWKIIHQISSVGIWTHNLFNMSLFRFPLDLDSLLISHPYLLLTAAEGQRSRINLSCCCSCLFWFNFAHSNREKAQTTWT